MALKDILKPITEEQFIELVSNSTIDEVKLIFLDAFYAKNIRQMELCFEHTKISENEDFFIQYCDKELNKYRDIIETFEKFTHIQ